MKKFKLNRYEVDFDKVTHYNQDLNVTTLSELIRNSAHKYAERPFWGEKINGSYQWMTYSEFNTKMLKMRSLLKKKGLGHGDRIAIIANNSVIFAQTIYAAYGLGGIAVPMYEVQSIDEWRFIFNDSKPKIAVVKNEAIRSKIQDLGIDSLETILVIDTGDQKTSLQALADAEEPLPESEDCAKPEDVSDIIYTSGTTGSPRGVELTHHNVVHDVIISAHMFDYGCNDRILSFLPWAHAFGKTVDLTLFPAIGCAIGLAESAKTIVTNLTEVNPTVMCAVPKIFNRVFDVLNLKMENNKVLRILFNRAQSIMHKARTSELSAVERIEYKVMDRVIGRKVRGVFGDSLKFCVSGGASLSPEVATFFEDFGVRVFEGYGMTEHAPVISINYNPDKIGSVGVPLPTVKVEIEPLEDSFEDDKKSGEIVITSECIMKGYYNSPEATAAVIDDKGRLHTGDTGYIDGDGSIHIIGRVKEQYKLNNGKYVVPSALEEKINAAQEIDFSIVFGSGKPCNVVLVHPSELCMQRFYASHPELSDASIETIEENAELRTMISSALERVSAGLRGYERPQKFAIILEEFTIDKGLLTPALKIKRRAVEKHYHDRIEKMYSEA